MSLPISFHRNARLTLKRCARTLVIATLSTTGTVAIADDVVLDAIVAIVNEGVVLASDVAAESRWIQQEAASSGQKLPESDVLQERVVQRLIEREIQRQHASRLGITIDATSVNRAIDRVARGNNLDALQFRNALRSQGVDYEQFRKSTRD